MNKRIEKIVLKAKESKNNLTTPRRDQIKKALEEKAFDYMIYQGYDEVYDVKPVKMAAVMENVENYWLTDGSMWASVDDDVLKVTIKYGYSYLTLYAELKEDEEQSLNTVESEEIEVAYNKEKNGIEVKFNSKPDQEVIDSLKANGFRWHRVKKIWYAKDTEERRTFISSLIDNDNKEDIKEVINIKNFNNIETLKTKYISNWDQLPGEIQDFIMSCDNYYICLQECLLYKNNKIIATMGIHKDDYEIEVDSFGADELMQWSVENGFESIKKDTDKIDYFENVKIKNLNEDIFVNALVPALNKNNTKFLNDEEIKEESYLEFYKVTDIVELNEEQYNYFINNLLDDYKFLEGKGGWKYENEEVLYYLGVAVTCEGKETLLVDPSGCSYARYLNKIVEDIDGSLEKKIDSLNIDNKDYNKALENIKEENLYITNFNSNMILEDERIILNTGLNHLQIVTGLTIKEMIKENKGVNIFNLEEYRGNLDVFKEQLEKVKNGEICILIPSETDIKLSKINFVERLENELLRVNKIENKNEDIEEENKNMEMNFDDILESFDNVEIENKNRLCDEDLNFLENLQEKFNNAKVDFKKYIEFYRENKLLDLEQKEVKLSCSNLEEYFVNKVVFIEGKSFISKIYNYFEKKYNITLEKIKTNDDYSLDFRKKEAEKNLNWFMETLDYNLVLDDIFNQLNGVSFKDREKEELKREFEYSNPIIKGNSINLKNSIYFNDISLKYNKNYEISYNSREKFKTIFKLIDTINNSDNENLCDNIIFEKNEVIGIHELRGDIIKSIQVFKNGSIKLTCNTGLNALNIAKEYLNYKEVA